MIVLHPPSCDPSEQSHGGKLVPHCDHRAAQSFLRRREGEWAAWAQIHPHVSHTIVFRLSSHDQRTPFELRLHWSHETKHSKVQNSRARNEQRQETRFLHRYTAAMHHFSQCFIARWPICVRHMLRESSASVHRNPSAADRASLASKPAGGVRWDRAHGDARHNSPIVSAGNSPRGAIVAGLTGGRAKPKTTSAFLPLALRAIFTSEAAPS